VLSPFDKEDSGLINEAMEQAVQTLEAALEELDKRPKFTED